MTEPLTCSEVTIIRDSDKRQVTGDQIRRLADEWLALSRVWRAANRPPDVPQHEMRAVIVATKTKAGKWRVFGAWYLNHLDLATEYDSFYGFDPCTGFYQHSFHHECDEWYEPIDVDFWAPMPEPPKV